MLDPGGDTYIQLPQNRLVALRPDGTERWVVQDAALGGMNFLGVSPDGKALMDGGRGGIGQPGWMRSYSTSDGSLDWSVDLFTEVTAAGPADLVVQGEPSFTPDSRRIYPDVADLLCESSRIGPEWADSNDVQTSARKSPAVRFSRRQPSRLSRLNRDAGAFLVPSDVKQVCNIGVYYPVNALVSTATDFCAYLYALDRDDLGALVEDCFGDSACPCGNTDPGAGCANSSGAGARLRASGSNNWQADDLTLTATDIPSNSFGLLFYGQQSTVQILGDGLRCVSGGPLGLHRFPAQNSEASGALGEGPGIVAASLAAFGANGIQSGSTWRFQVWYHDNSGPCSNGFNLSNAVQLTFEP